MLEDESVNSAHHHNDVENNNQRRHRAAESKAGVQNNERNCEERQPDMGAQPALHRADSPENNFLPDAEEGCENKNRQRDGTKDQTKRRPAGIAILNWLLNKHARQLQRTRQ